MSGSIPYLLYDTQGRLHPAVRRALRRARCIALFLDYDGTLTRIRSTPGEAVLSKRAQSILHTLAQKPNMTVSIVTGRSLKQIRSLLPSVPLDIAANHGLQISQPRRTWIHPSAQSCIPLLAGLHRRLKQQLKAIPGILLENKQVVLTIHYRNVPGGQIAKIRTTVKEVLEPFVGRLRMTTGKKVIEIRPAVSWTKGDAIMSLLAGRRRQKVMTRPMKMVSSLFG
jgi:trehalose 6-phosphate phosphatase